MAILRDAQDPIGDLALFANFLKSFVLEVAHGKPLATSTSRTTVNLLRGGNVDLHRTLVDVFAVKGLNREYKPVNQDFSLHSE